MSTLQPKETHWVGPSVVTTLYATGVVTTLYVTKIFFKMLNILLLNHQHTCVITAKSLHGLIFRKQ